MKKQQVSFELTVYESIDELSSQERMVVEAAEQAKENAYAPYSEFSVGAALLLEDGTIVLGNNQENASYPAGLCAERVAIFYAGANHPDNKIEILAVTASSKAEKVTRPVPPCGMCRQVIAEYEHKQNAPITILFKGDEGPIHKCQAMADLLPFIFNKSYLGS